MGVLFESGYSLPSGDQPTTHARIAHSSNWFEGGAIAASTTATGFFADAPDNSLTYEKWSPTALPATWETEFDPVLSGVELVTNGGFVTDSDWTKGDGWSIGSGVASCDGTQTGSTDLTQTLAITIGRTYKITYDLTVSAGFINRVRLGGEDDGTDRTVSGSYTSIIIPTTTGFLQFRADPDFIGTIDNVSVQEILPVDYCAIAGHTMGTNGNTLQVQYDSTGGGVWVDVINIAITDDEPIFCIFEPKTFQKWRIRISGGTAPEVAVIRFGTALQMERPIYGGHTPINMNRKTTVRSTKSELGQWLGRTKIRNMLSGEFQWSNLTSDFVRANIPAFIQAIETEPFFVAWRPATFTDVNYCWTMENPTGPPHVGPRDLMSFGVSVEALGYE